MKEIQLRNKRKEVTGIALVSDEDFLRVSQYSWWKAKTERGQHDKPCVYAATKIEKKNVYMHRLLCPNSFQVDHKDGNGLNNQRNNLRPCTATQNQGNRRGTRKGNRSGYKGVTCNKGKWVARLQKKNKTITLGRFINIEDAARAYDAAALEYFGEFAWVNFPESRALALAKKTLDNLAQTIDTIESREELETAS